MSEYELVEAELAARRNNGRQHLNVRTYHAEHKDHDAGAHRHASPQEVSRFNAPRRPNGPDKPNGPDRIRELSDNQFTAARRAEGWHGDAGGSRGSGTAPFPDYSLI